MPNSSYKGFYGIMKGIVTRVDNPTKMLAENDGRKKIQVCVPSYHGEVDNSKIGSGDDPGLYPWAQVCSGLFGGGSSNTASSTGGFFQNVLSLLYDNSSNDSSSLEIIYPSVGDIVWLAFEGGDIRCPIYIGSLSPNTENQQSCYSNSNNNSILYTSNGTPLRSICLDVISEMSGLDYDTISSDFETKFGIFGWSGNSAKDLFTSIRSAAQTEFDNILINNNAEKFIDDLSKSWTGYKVQINSNVYNALKSILRTSTGKSYQDNKALLDINSMINNAIMKGLSRQSTIVMYVYLCFKGYKSFADSSASSSNDSSLDAYYISLMNKFSSYPTSVTSKINSVYNYISNLENNGTISKNIDGGSDISTPTGGTNTVTQVVTTTNDVVATSGPNTDAIKPKNFKQYEGSWADQMFGPGPYKKDRTYAQAACSVTAMADIVWKFADTSVTPKTIGDLAVSWGYRTATSYGLTNTSGFYSRCASNYGFIYKGATTGASASYNKLRNALLNGRNNTLAIIGVKGIFSNNGHFVVAWKVNGDITCICDPGINSKSSKGQARENCKSSDLKAAINSVYLFEKR